MGKVTIPQSALSRSQPPLHKGAQTVEKVLCRGAQCAPVEFDGHTKLPRGVGDAAPYA